MDWGVRALDRRGPQGSQSADMILTCPACATSYFISDDAIGPDGRRVRCKSCGHDWRATPDDTSLDLGEVAAAISSPSTDVVSVVETEAMPPALPQAFRARAQEKQRTQKAVKQGLGWSLLVVAILTILTSAYVMRDNIVARVPSLASAYRLFGISTNAVGLEFEAVNARFAAHDTSRVVISGAIRNIRGHEIVVPPIRISMRDSTGREIGHEIVRLAVAPVLPGKVQGFSAILPNSDGRFASASTTFVAMDRKPEVAVAEPKAPLPRETSAVAPAEKAATPASQPTPLNATPASHIQPQAASQGGLRRISHLVSEPAGLDTEV